MNESFIVIIVIIEFLSTTEELPAQINKNYYYNLCFYEYLTRHVPALAMVGVERGDRRLSVLFARASSSSFFSTTAFKSPVASSSTTASSFFEYSFLQLQRSWIVFRIQLWDEFSTVYHLWIIIFRLFWDVEFVDAASS